MPICLAMMVATINNTYDFAIGRKLCNLPALREIGFSANRRLLNVQTLSHDCSIGKEKFNSLIQLIVHDKQRASASILATLWSSP
jgi:uncharacterized membrane protein affecting hemolysin expression